MRSLNSIIDETTYFYGNKPNLISPSIKDETMNMLHRINEGLLKEISREVLHDVEVKFKYMNKDQL